MSTRNMSICIVPALAAEVVVSENKSEAHDRYKVICLGLELVQSEVK